MFHFICLKSKKNMQYEKLNTSRTKWTNLGTLKEKLIYVLSK